jgi:hypothetical protein
VTAREYDINSFFLVRDNPISREGIFPYSGAQIGAEDKDRIYQVYRPAEELAHPDTLASFQLMPIIDDHTMLGEGATPAEEVGVDGVIGENVKVTDGVMTANLKIFSGALAEKIKNGKKELSCGYRCVYDFTPGEWNGQKYDAVQRQLRGNHLALVKEGRMGPSVSVLDQMVFTVDAKELEPAMDEIKEMLAVLAARMDALEAAAADKYDEKSEMTDEEKAAKDAEEAAAAAAEEKAAKDAEEAAAAAAAEDEDEDEGGENAAMDAVFKELADLKSKVSGMVVLDEAAVIKTLARKTSLAERLAQHVGTFDHAAMTFDAVVKYGVEKLGLKDVPKGAEAVALDAALQVRSVPAPHKIATDGKTSALSASVAEYTGA